MGSITENLKLYLHYAAAAVRGQLTHKVSFFLTLLGQFLASFSAFAGISFLLTRFRSVGGFSLEEILITFSVTLISFSLAECFFRGFDVFSTLLADGSFDRMLLRPRGLILQILGSRMELTRFGRLLQAMLILVYALSRTQLAWTPAKVLVFLLMIISGVILYACLFTIQAALTFFTTEGLEVMNILTDGSREFGAYPYVIYGENLLRLLTFVVPLALVQYYPLLWVLGRSDNAVLALTPLFAFLFIIPTALIWRAGVRRYASIGS